MFLLDYKIILTKLLFTFFNLNLICCNKYYYTSCYDKDNGPRKCNPDFVNAAYNLKATATNTCGKKPIEFCKQTTLHSVGDDEFSNLKVCDICDWRYPEKYYISDFLTDYNNQAHPTWWQSETMNEGIQSPNSVNITLNLGKSFEITYIQIRFHSPRPESFAIYKKTNLTTTEWLPYQYYSASCENTYGIKPNKVNQITRGNEAIPLCSDEFSDIVPLTGALVAFSTLEARPSAFNFEESDELKEWVTATDVKIVLNRLNTFGDEIFNKSQILKSYYYAISDISIGGRCKCNGHANRCIMKQGENFEEQLKCDCQHNTDGADCEKCLPFYNDLPWAPATHAIPYECKACNCNGKSKKCFFDNELYQKTGRGGHCIECEDHTDGPYCEKCKIGFYRFDNQCIDCKCHHLASENLMCDANGACRCKPGVTGVKCDRCMTNFYGLSAVGCTPCNCSDLGSLDSPPICDPNDGQCRCKINVEGQNCDRCKPGNFNLEKLNVLGCQKCFCFDHSNDCTSEKNYVIYDIKTQFDTEINHWRAINDSNQYTNLAIQRNYGIFIPGSDYINEWFVAPVQYLGNQRLSYGRAIKLKIKFDKNYHRAKKEELVIENINFGLRISKQLIYDSNDRIHSSEFYQLEALLKETEGWVPILSRKEFNVLLTNITAMRVRASKNIYLYSFELTSAKLISEAVDSSKNDTIANWIEVCSCPIGYSGNSCETCQVGYHREIVNGDSSVRCIPCNCNNHSVSCDVLNGKCYCIHHSAGDNCEKCKDGYYGNSLIGTENDCKKCQCPDDGPCVEILNYQTSKVEVVCLNCPEGSQGNSCEMCEDSYFFNSISFKCERCTCNGNTDDNAIGNCDTSDGKCLKCIYNTTGDQCEKCLMSYWGNALTSLKCHACECNSYGTFSKINEDRLDCDISNGQCKCKPHVKGRQCDHCEENYWNITSNNGCIECQCDPLGSLNLTCNIETGQCYCKTGVSGKKCDSCTPYHFNFTENGCESCFCNSFGSTSMQCDDFGKCKCKIGIDGTKCDKCVENHYSFKLGCLKCNECYDLVKSKVLELRDIEAKFKKALDGSIITPNLSEKSIEIKKKLDYLKNLINYLHNHLYESRLGSKNFTEFLKFLENEVNIFKTIEKEYDKRKPQYDELEYLVSSVGNIELSLTNIEINAEQAEIALKEKNMTNTNTESKLMQNYAKRAREASMSHSQLMRNILEKINAINDIKKFGEVARNVQDIKQFDAIKYSYKYTHHHTFVNELINESHQIKNSIKVSIHNVNENIMKFDINEAGNIENIEIKNFEGFIEDINNTSSSLLSNLSALIRKFELLHNGQIKSILEQTHKIFESSKTHENEYHLLNEVVQKNKDLSEGSVEEVSTIYRNLTNILDIIKNFEHIIKKGRAKAEQAKNDENNVKKNVDEFNALYRLAFGNVQNLQHEIHHLFNEEEKFNRKIDATHKASIILKENSEKLNEASNAFLKNLKPLHNHIEQAVEADELFKKTSSLTDTIDSVYTNIHDAETKLQNFHSGSLNLNIKHNALENLNRNFDAFINRLDSDDVFWQELNRLENLNILLLPKIISLENIIPVLELKISNLDTINKSLSAYKCYPRRINKVDFDELNND